ncbi:LPXTG cell wall anchor domain-containing protein [Streptomyces sp. MRC013]|uniref:LPXTG cell wall anchor domain-containing protein n=1 Tax=Streptomyces sp. MRC013 TaxID=2898276 RepID=UPI0020273C54|nr:LPXTG cell wall anchor domain-containing protein [Streptomyces sp. MRC013]URM91090.1 LPXTG cell wall anchor domain-containing protein [Streptomyces sp. MRC013]
MRTFSKTTGALVAAAVCGLTLVPAAHAAPATKGDNGTVKIHDARTGEELTKNEPKVCEFYLDAFKFDAAQKVTWEIQAWAKNEAEKGTTVKGGAITLDAEGHGRTGDMTLPDGQYKLFWSWEGMKGAPKHKVFKSDCPDGKPVPSGTPSTTPSGTPSTTPSGTPSGTPGGTPSGTPSEPPASSPAPSSTPGAPAPSEAAPGGAAPTGAPSPSGGSPEGDLAETGSSAPVAALGGLAAALVAGGAFLVMRRRKAQQH